ncbi:MAG: elongation factor P [Patescibacteria group bacterium]|nr:elongation factor P [Patescibacteria group bacterium]
MLSLTKIKVGTKIIVNDEPFAVLFSQHSKTGRAGAVLRTKLKNIKTGSCVSKTFQGADKIELAVIETKKAQFLYSNNDRYFFMDSVSYEQFDIDAVVIGENAKFLTEETKIDILYFDECPINIELPIKMEFEVTEAPPSIRGNTTDGGSKQVTIETGAKINVPLFVKTGDKIRINTQTGQYAERVND